MNEVNNKRAACIVYYQDLASLQALINNLNTQTLKPSEIFVADNDSSTSANMNNSDLRVSVIKLSSNLGFGVAANSSIKKAIENGYEKFILFSQDVLLENTSCEKIINKLMDNKGIVFPTMLNRKTNQVFSKGGVINIFTGKIALKTRKVPKNIYWADGSCLGFDKNTFLKTNGFTEKFFMYFEDVDFCLKARKNQIQLNHVDTIASQNPNGPTAYLRSKNSILVARNYNNKIFIMSVFKRNLVGALLLLIKFNFKEGFARIKGIKDGLRLDFERN